MAKQKVEKYGLQSKLLRKLTRHYGAPGSPPPISQTSLSFILHGKRRPTPEQAVMLERVFNELGYAISRFDMVFAYKPGRSILELDKTQED